jgi:hypothetical protein
MILSTRRRRSVALSVAAAVVVASAATVALAGVGSDPPQTPTATGTSAATGSTAAPGSTPATLPGPATTPPATIAPGGGSTGSASSAASASSTGTRSTSSGPVLPPPPATAPLDGPGCAVSGRSVVQPLAAAAVTGRQWEEASPSDDVTYDLSQVTSTAYPASVSMFAVGTGAPAARTCVLGGTVRGRAEDRKTWDYYHDKFNAACLKIIAREWMQVSGLRCDNVEDGIKPQESAINANNAEFYVSGTHLTRIRDDCMENDYTVGGVLYDNLWEQCNTGLSERPSSDRQWRTPPSETVVLDHMLIGLYPTPHVENGKTVMGENALFKWSGSGNRVVIKCSIFKVNTVSLNGTSAMGLPAGTVVDDSACPDTPSTLVWLGGGEYPGWAGDLRVVSDESVWTSAVAAWKAAHG